MNSGKQELNTNILPQVSANKSLNVTSTTTSVLNGVLQEINLGSWYEMGKAQCESRNFYKAIYLFKKELSYNASHWQSHIQLAFAYVCISDIDLSFLHLIESMKVGYQHLSNFNNELSENRWRIIREFYDKIGNEIPCIDASCEPFLNNKSLTYPIIGYGYDPNEALVHMTICDYSEVSPKWLVSYFAGKAEYEMGNFKKAIKELSEAIKSKPNFIDALKFRAKAKIRIEDYIDAIRDFNKLIDLNPNDSEANLYKDMAFSFLDTTN